MYKIKGADKIQQRLENIADKLHNKAPLLHLLGNYKVSDIQKKIKRGIPPPPSPATQAVKRGRKSLMDTGQLLNSINYKIQGDTVKVGTPLKYAPVLQYGATITPKSAEKLAFPASAYTRRLLRRYDGSIKGTLEGLKREGWKIWFTEGAIMGKRKNGRRNYVLFIRKDRVVIPPRPFIYFDEKDYTAVHKIIYGWLMEK